MPQNLTYSGARIPTTTEADTVPADLLRFGTDIDQMLVLKATSQADRDAKYANVNAGTLVSCAALGIVWQKISTPPTSPSWRVLNQNADPVTSGVATYSANFSPLKQGAKIVNGSIYLLVQGTYTGPDVVGKPTTDLIPGDIDDLSFATIASDYLPPAAILPQVGAVRTSVAGGAWQMFSNQIIITSLSAGARIRTGDSVSVSASWPAA